MSETVTASSLDHDPFLKSIRALRTYLSPESPSATGGSLHQQQSADDEIKISELERQQKALTFKLEDALKDSQRERKLRASLEKAFDDLTTNRNEIKEYLDELMNPPKSGSSNNNKNAKRASAETRILAVEAERIETLRACEGSNKKLAATEIRLTQAERRTEQLETNLATKEKEYSDQLAQKNETIQSHEESKESVESSLKEEQSKHTTTQSDLQNANDSIKELEKAKSSLETSMKNQAVDYEAKVKNLNETNSSLEQKLEKIQKGKEELEKILNEEQETNKKNDEQAQITIDRLERDINTVSSSQLQYQAEFLETKNRLEQAKTQLEAFSQKPAPAGAANAVVVDKDEKECLGSAKKVMLEQQKLQISSLGEQLKELQKQQTSEPAVGAPTTEKDKDDAEFVSAEPSSNPPKEVTGKHDRDETEESGEEEEAEVVEENTSQRSPSKKTKASEEHEFDV